MRNAFLIAWREFMENVKTKGFWIGLLLFPLIWTMAIQIPLLLDKKGTPTRHFIMVDASGEFEGVVTNAFRRAEQRRVLEALHAHATANLARPADFREFLSKYPSSGDGAVDRFLASGGQTFFLEQIQPGLRTNAPPFKTPTPRYRRVPLPEGVTPTTDTARLAAELRPWLRGERSLRVDEHDAKLFAAILIPSNLMAQVIRPGETPSPSPAAVAGNGRADSQRGIEYWCENQADETLRTEVERAVNSEVRRREYVRRGVDLALVRGIEATRAEVTALNPKKEKGEEQVGVADKIRQWMPSVFVYLLWVGIFAISQMLLNSVIEEKSNRIIEVLLSSVTPGELMMGKLAGIASTGLCMLTVWILSFVGMILWKAGGGPPSGGGGGGAAGIPHDIATILQTSWLIPAFFIYFVLGYLMYAGLILALGSTCNTIKEAQNFMGVIVLFLMVPLMTMTFIPRDPNGPVATVLSWIPFYTPFVMMNRVTASPPLRDVIGTMVLLVVSTSLVLWGAGRVFRIGVLRTGQPPKLREILRWLRAPR